MGKKKGTKVKIIKGAKASKTPKFSLGAVKKIASGKIKVYSPKKGK